MAGDRSLLSDEQAASLLATVPQWHIRDGLLMRMFEFATYQEGVSFVVKAAGIADAMDHHPDLLLGYGKVTATTHTHDAGGLTKLDFELAAKLDTEAHG